MENTGGTYESLFFLARHEVGLFMVLWFYGFMVLWFGVLKHQNTIIHCTKTPKHQPVIVLTSGLESSTLRHKRPARNIENPPRIKA
jgi:hypothetical protein